MTTSARFDHGSMQVTVWGGLAKIPSIQHAVVSAPAAPTPPLDGRRVQILLPAADADYQPPGMKWRRWERIPCVCGP